VASPEPTLRELEEREEAIERAAERVEKLEAESREADAKAREAVADLEGYYHEVGAGEIEPDPSEERRLKAASRRRGPTAS
jgi:hypothetical protein